MEPVDFVETWYSSKESLSPYEKMIIRFDGIDCSGLIYSATNGFTPRNTADMVHFGRAVSMGEDLKPLDLIVDFGHVVIVVDKTWSIQSKEKFGVFLVKTKEILSSLQRRKKPINEWDSSQKEEIFIIRRFL
jgi:cell wall-associated NlpC family hydrolase